jgi:hypothetical protein
VGYNVARLGHMLRKPTPNPWWVQCNKKVPSCVAMGCLVLSAVALQACFIELSGQREEKT